MVPLTWSGVSADLTVCLVVHLALTRDLPAGGAAVAATGYLTDVATGAPTGLHIVVFTGLFLAGYAVRTRVFLQTVPTIAAAALVASLMATALTWLLAAVFIPDLRHYAPFLVLAVPRALLTVPFVFAVRAAALWVDRHTSRLARLRVVLG